MLQREIGDPLLVDHEDRTLQGQQRIVASIDYAGKSGVEIGAVVYFERVQFKTQLPRRVLGFPPCQARNSASRVP